MQELKLFPWQLNAVLSKAAFVNLAQDKAKVYWAITRAERSLFRVLSI
jgi:hypothetical protein